MGFLTVEEFRLNLIFVAPEPIPEEILLSKLTEIGYAEIKEIPKRIGSETFGIERLNIAKKGGCQILYDAMKGIIGVVGKKGEEVLSCFFDVKSTIEKSEIDSQSQLKNYELSFNGRVFVKGKMRPLEKISKQANEKNFDEMGNIVGEEVTSFCVRIVPKKHIKILSDYRQVDEWFDFFIYPYISNPQYYSFKVVFRKPDLDRFIKEVKEIEKKVMNLINFIGK